MLLGICGYIEISLGFFFGSSVLSDIVWRTLIGKIQISPLNDILIDSIQNTQSTLKSDNILRIDRTTDVAAGCRSRAPL